MPSPKRALLYLRTLRSLTPRQWVYLPIRRVQRLLPARPRVEPAPLSKQAQAITRALEAMGPRNADCVSRADRVLGGQFRFAGVERLLRRVDWTSRMVSHLWSYHLHYFEYADDLAWAYRTTGDQRYARRFVELATSWIDETDGRGDGWEPYPTATRVVEWLRAVLLFGDAISPTERAKLLTSAYAQLKHLAARIEWHLLANHLQRNLQALAIGGLVLDTPDATRWRHTYGAMLWEQLLEQVLEDGGHFERSPMYHMVAASDFLETALIGAAAGVPLPADAAERLRLMVAATDVFCRPDGTLHLFNDAAQGSAPSRARIAHLGGLALGSAPSPPRHTGAAQLGQTGYFAFAAPDGDRLIVDCGEPGPAYQPGHAHCDLLSFELDIAGKPLILDSGISGYEGDTLREYARSTRAHNTITIDGKDQHEMWGTFRVARRAKVLGASAAETSDGRWSFRGAYRPYHSPLVTHRRTISHYAGVWRVDDQLEGADNAEVRSYVHLHPNASVSIEGSVAVVRLGDLSVRVSFFGFDSFSVSSGQTAPAQGWHCPEFGKALAAPCVVAAARSAGQPVGYAIQRTQ